MTRYKEYMQQAAELQSKTEDWQKRELAAVITQIRGLIAQHQLSAGDLGFHGRAGTAVKTRDGRSPFAPRYLDPYSGSTWDGRGRKPRWLDAAIKSGRSAQYYLIGG
jgi:DNA-binding protein H-NS